MWTLLAKRLLFLPLLLLITVSGHFFLLYHQAKLTDIPQSITQQLTIHASQTHTASIDDLDAAMEISEHTSRTFPQFFSVLAQLFTLDFGQSLHNPLSAWALVKSKLPLSCLLTFSSMAILYALAILIGVIKAHRHQQLFGFFDTGFTLISIVPSSLLGIALIFIFASPSGLGFFPLKHLYSYHLVTNASLSAQIVDVLWHLVLPISTIVLPRLLPLSQFIDTACRETYLQSFVFAAKAKGINGRQLFYHHIAPHLRLAILSTIPRTFLKLFFSSTLITEVLFSLDGLGYLTYRSALSQDYPVIFCLLCCCTILTALCYCLMDLLFYALDPRIHFGGQ